MELNLCHESEGQVTVWSLVSVAAPLSHPGNGLCVTTQPGFVEAMSQETDPGICWGTWGYISGTHWEVKPVRTKMVVFPQGGRVIGNNKKEGLQVWCHTSLVVPQKNKMTTAWSLGLQGCNVAGTIFSDHTPNVLPVAMGSLEGGSQFLWVGTICIAISDADAPSEPVFGVGQVSSILSQKPAADVGSVASSVWFWGAADPLGLCVVSTWWKLQSPGMYLYFVFW